MIPTSCNETKVYELPVSCLWPSDTTCNLFNKLRHQKNQCFQWASLLCLAFQPVLLVGGGLSGVEKTKKKKKVESALEVENPVKPFLGAHNTTVASWANIKLFSLVS